MKSSRVTEEKQPSSSHLPLVKSYSFSDAKLPDFLDPHQRDGVRWILTRGRSYLAHAPGAGKTWEAIVAALLIPSRHPALFVVPPSLTVNWARELLKIYGLMDPTARAWPRMTIVPESREQQYAGWNAEFLIVPDSMLDRPWVQAQLTTLNFRLVAVDEASRMKEASSQRTIALFGGTLKDGRKTPGIIRKAKHAVLLDGSPMPNRPMELWAPTFAMCPEAIDFMSQQDFGFRYCGAKINDYGRWEFKLSCHEEELKRKLQEKFMHVVPESGLSHPERRRSILPMTGDARSPEQKSWEKKHLGNLKLNDISEDVSQGDLAHFRAELGLRKAPWVSDYVASRLREKNESILLFAWHRDVVFELEKSLRKYHPRVVMGGTLETYREKAFQEFQSGKARLIIGNIGAMGRGHNLQRANRVIFAEYSWTDELNKQCEKRASRRGNENELIRCEYIVCPNSLDEAILNAVFTKESRVKKVIG